MDRIQPERITEDVVRRAFTLSAFNADDAQGHMSPRPRPRLEHFEGVTPRGEVTLKVTFEDGATKETKLLARIDTDNELDYVKNGGILHYVLRQRAAA